MAMTQYSGETEVISKLGTTPQERGLSTEQFKAKFDEGLKGFVEWFNSTHKTQFDAKAETTSLNALQNEVNEHMADNLSHNNNGQLTFPVTQNPSSNPNVLDDYEEGAWTPSLTFGGNSDGLTHWVRTAGYTKIGNLVYVNCFIAIQNKGTSTGVALIEGLPFAVSFDYDVAASIATEAITYSGTIQAVMSRGSSVITLQQVTEAGVGTQLTDANFSGSYIHISATYIV